MIRVNTYWQQLDVDASAMPCFIGDTGSAGAPGVVVCMHAPGVDAFIQNIVGRLVQNGYCAIAPDLHHRDPNVDDDPLTRVGRLRDEQILDDLDAASEHLRGLANVDSDRIGTIGFCMGGRVAYLHASADPDLSAAVVFYGGNILKAWGDGPAPIERSGTINCPVLGLFGNDDANPSPDDVSRIAETLSAAGKTFQFHRYDGAGHAFLNESRPSYRPEPAADAWQKCIAWLDRYLK